MLKILLVAATQQELDEIEARLPTTKLGGLLNIDLTTKITGVGILETTFSIFQWVEQLKPHVVLQVGIAGSFETSEPLGNVVVIDKDTVADLGVFEQNQWKSVFEMGFTQANQQPYINKFLTNPHVQTFNFLNWPTKTGITVNQVSVHTLTIRTWQTQLKAQVETMEGAALHFVCLKLGVPFLQIRAISNLVGDRNKKRWAFDDCFTNLASSITQWLENVDSKHEDFMVMTSKH